MRRTAILALSAIAVMLALLPGPAQATVAGPVNIHSGTNFNMCLDVAGFSFDDNAAILHFECNGAPNQVFHEEFAGTVTVDGNEIDVVRIVSDWSGKCVGTLGVFNTESGTRVVQQTCTGVLSQLWLTTRPPGGGFNAVTYVNRNTIGGIFDNKRCLDVPGGTTGRAQMQIWSCNQTAAQVFTRLPTAS